MRAKEFINEDHYIGRLEDGIRHTLPRTYVLPNLPNQDPYLQYRFGLSLAASGAGAKKPTPETPWGENMAVLAYTSGDQEIIQNALAGSHEAAVQISTDKSEENPDTNIKSPVPAKKKNRYGV